MHEQKVHFVTSSVVTLHKWNLRIQIGQVLQFCRHSISAKYNVFRLHTFEGETFGSFDVLLGHRGVTWLVTMENISGAKYYCFYQFPKHTFKGNKVIAPRIPKFCAYHNPHGMCWPFSLKKPSVFRDLILILPMNIPDLFMWKLPPTPNPGTKTYNVLYTQTHTNLEIIACPSLTDVQ